MRDKVLGSAAVVATAGIIAAGYVYWRRRRQPTEWKHIGYLENIYMSPLKSGFFAEQKEVICDVPGLTGTNKRYRDRSFMVLNSEGRFVTGRNFPLITQVKCDIYEDQVTFSFVLNEEIRPLKLSLSELEGRKPTKVRFGWDSNKRMVKVVDCGDEAAAWIQSCIVPPDQENNPSDIGTLFRIVHLVDNTLCDDRGLLFDETSYMLLSQKSLEDLNTRLTNPVSMRRFRPNFVVSGTSEPFEEDNWKWVRIGDVVFQYIKPCLRCSFTTVDDNTGEKDKDKTMEPLKTLKSYRQFSDPALKRKFGEAPIFGAHLGLRSSPGRTIRKGDPVFINLT